jgi:hypothetical protein
MTRHVAQYRILKDITFQRFINEPTRLPEQLGIQDGPSPHLAESHPSIVYRYASRSEDTRTLIACILPESGFLPSTGYVHGVATFGGRQEVLALLAVMNSFCCDWWVRRIVDRHVTAPVVNNLPLPRWNEKDIEDVSHLASELVSRGEQTTVGGLGRLLDTSDLEAFSVSELRAHVEARVAIGFGIATDEMPTIFNDFSAAACPIGLREQIVRIMEAHFE